MSVSPVEYGSGVARQVVRGKATPKVEHAARDDPTGASHAPHLPHDLIDLRHDVEGQRGDAAVEGSVRMGHMARITELVDDVSMRPLTAGAVDVGRRGVDPGSCAAALRPRCGYAPRADRAF